MERIANDLETQNVRVICDTRNEKISYKIREHSIAKIPIILAIGEREVENKTVSVRRIGSKQTETISLKSFKELITQEVREPDCKNSK